MAIRKMSDLRERLIETFEQLGRKEIDAQSVLASAKLVDTVINSLKVQMEYAKVTEQQVHLPFLIDSPENLIDHETERKLLK